MASIRSFVTKRETRSMLCSAVARVSIARRRGGTSSRRRRFRLEPLLTVLLGRLGAHRPAAAVIVDLVRQAESLAVTLVGALNRVGSEALAAWRLGRGARGAPARSSPGVGQRA